ncbi:MAG: hypothetical protein H7330_11480 [Hymenobacteraceae bacterium]|nr:hypothetical protein [Hymenobacteraceae bacterium]
MPLCPIPPPPPRRPPHSTWGAPTEAGRAQQLLDTHSHLATTNKALDWLPNPQLLPHAQAHVHATATKARLAADRPSQT